MQIKNRRGKNEKESRLEALLLRGNLVDVSIKSKKKVELTTED